eukprot:5194192-Lingulodinium_polyedra.AAC.1
MLANCSECLETARQNARKLFLYCLQPAATPLKTVVKPPRDCYQTTPKLPHDWSETARALL